jgi:hypothetical protein
MFLNLLWNENLQLQLVAILAQVNTAPDGYFWTEIAKQGIVALLLLGANYYQYKENATLKQELKEERKKNEDRRDSMEKVLASTLHANAQTQEMVAEALKENTAYITRRAKP